MGVEQTVISELHSRVFAEQFIKYLSFSFFSPASNSAVREGAEGFLGDRVSLALAPRDAPAGRRSGAQPPISAGFRAGFCSAWPLSEGGDGVAPRFSLRRGCELRPGSQDIKECRGLGSS